MLYGPFCARSIDVPAVLASFYEYNGFYLGLARIPRVHPPFALYGCTLYLDGCTLYLVPWVII